MSLGVPLWAACGGEARVPRQQRTAGALRRERSAQDRRVQKGRGEWWVGMPGRLGFAGRTEARLAEVPARR